MTTCTVIISGTFRLLKQTFYNIMRYCEITYLEIKRKKIKKVYSVQNITIIIQKGSHLKRSADEVWPQNNNYTINTGNEVTFTISVR